MIVQGPTGQTNLTESNTQITESQTTVIGQTANGTPVKQKNTSAFGKIKKFFSSINFIKHHNKKRNCTRTSTNCTGLNTTTPAQNGPTKNKLETPTDKDPQLIQETILTPISMRPLVSKKPTNTNEASSSENNSNITEPREETPQKSTSFDTIKTQQRQENTQPTNTEQENEKPTNTNEASSSENNSNITKPKEETPNEGTLQKSTQRPSFQTIPKTQNKNRQPKLIIGTHKNTQPTATEQENTVPQSEDSETSNTKTTSTSWKFASRQGKETTSKPTPQKTKTLQQTVSGQKNEKSKNTEVTSSSENNSNITKPKEKTKKTINIKNIRKHKTFMGYSNKSTGTSSSSTNIFKPKPWQGTINRREQNSKPSKLFTKTNNQQQIEQKIGDWTF